MNIDELPSLVILVSIVIFCILSGFLVFHAYYD